MINMSSQAAGETPALTATPSSQEFDLARTSVRANDPSREFPRATAPIVDPKLSAGFQGNFTRCYWRGIACAASRLAFARLFAALGSSGHDSILELSPGRFSACWSPRKVED